MRAFDRRIGFHADRCELVLLLPGFGNRHSRSRRVTEVELGYGACRREFGDLLQDWNGNSRIGRFAEPEPVIIKHRNACPRRNDPGPRVTQQLLDASIFQCIREPKVKPRQGRWRVQIFLRSAGYSARR